MGVQVMDYTVEIVTDYAVILTDVTPDYHLVDVHEDDIIEMAKSNLIDLYGWDIDKLRDVNDIIVHEKGN